MDDASSRTQPPAHVKVWDGFVRLTHWVVAGLVFYLFFFSDGGSWVHRTAGTVALCAVGLRLLWGLACRGHGRLAAFWPRWSHTLVYLRAARAGSAPRHIGHNPLGAWMIVLLWSLIIALGTTGWMARMDYFWGEEWLQNLHVGIAWALIIAVGVHVCGVLAMSLAHRENLLAAMITGRKRDHPPPGQ